LDQLDSDGLIEWSSTGNPRKIIYADDAEANGKRVQDIWEFKDSPYPSYPTEKNLNLLNLIIQTSSNPGQLVFDCFCGSGTTLLAAHQLHRYWIGIDNSDIAIQTTIRRFTPSPDALFDRDVPYNYFDVKAAQKDFSSHSIPTAMR
jgi:adenine-specific DNA-methyltransferase